jgi:hypothetical protein
MNKFSALIFILLFFVSTKLLAADVDPEVSATSLITKQECTSRIMAMGVPDVDILKSVVEECNKYPLSDDLSVQLLAAMIGPDFIKVLDVYIGFAGGEHNLKEDDVLVLVGGPLHSVLRAFSYVMMGIFLILVSISVFTQVVRWQGGNFQITLSDFSAKQGANHIFSGLLTVPVVGWVTPLQAVALFCIVVAVFISKWLISFVYLGAFFGDVAGNLRDSVEENVVSDLGKAIMIEYCDIKRREEIVSNIQTQIRSRKKSDLQGNELYQCLTQSSGSGQIVKVVEGAYQIMPASLAQTQKCIIEHKDKFLEWGVAEPDSCGHITIELPQNSSHPNVPKEGVAPPALINALNFYTNARITRSQREIALQYHEYSCRKGERPIFEGVEVSSCLVPEMSGDHYRYKFKKNKVTGDDELSFYNMPFTDLSRREFLSDTKLDMADMQSALLDNTPGLLRHVSDLIAPVDSESDLTIGAQKAIDAARENMENDINETSDAGFSEADAYGLASNIQRGVWASGSLYFDGLTDEVDESVLAALVKSVYSVSTPNASRYGGIGSVLDLMDLWELNNMATRGIPLSLGPVGGIVNAKIPTVMPSFDLYKENADCWFDQLACKIEVYNPFRQLGKEGVSIFNAATNRLFVLLGFETVYKVFSYITIPNVDKKMKQRVMLFETYQELIFVYLLIGIFLAIVIPAIPLLKVLSMLVSWVFDVVRELIGLQIKISLSPAGEQGDGLFSEDVKAAMARLYAHAFYLIFVVVGIGVTFFMFSFLFTINVFVIGSLHSTIGWGGELNSIEGIVVTVIMDIIITLLLLYEVRKCTSYMEKLPKSLAEHFGVKVSDSDGVVEQMFNFLKNHTPGSATKSMSKLFHKVGT